MQTKGWMTLAIVVATIATTGPAKASLITFGYTGTITNVLVDGAPADPDNVISVNSGDTIQGTYSFEDSVVGTPVSGTSSLYSYVFFSANPGTFQMTATIKSGATVIAAFGYPTDPSAVIGDASLVGKIQVTDDPTGDAYSVEGIKILESTDSAQSFKTASLSILLADSTGAALNSSSLPTVPPDYTLFDTLEFTLTIPFVIDEGGNNSEGSYTIQGQITSLTTAVPEPSSACLVVSGLVSAFLGATRRRRR